MRVPLFSVVTVTLNCAEDACRTARSVLEQDFGDYEYLIKDGDSSDETVSRLKALGVNHIEVSKDGGIYQAMNQALGLCRGRYVWYLNAGDLFAAPTVLSAFAAQIQAHGFPRLVYGDIQTLEKHPFWEQGASEGPWPIRSHDKLTRCYLYRRTICHQAWAMEKALYEQCGGLKEELRFAADYDVLLQAILRLHVAYLRVPQVCVTYQGGGFSERNFELARLESYQVLRRYFPPWERWAYESVSQAARWVVHGRWFSRLYPHLPPDWRARLAGL
jgi:putative colanic acid biosynthesis glycosyltransferase